MSRVRAELGRVANDRDNYKHKWEALQRALQQQQQQQQQHAQKASTSRVADASPNYYLVWLQLTIKSGKISRKIGKNCAKNPPKIGRKCWKMWKISEKKMKKMKKMLENTKKITKNHRVVVREKKKRKKKKKITLHESSFDWVSYLNRLRRYVRSASDKVSSFVKALVSAR